MLKRPSPSPARRLAGHLAALSLSCCVAAAAWATQPKQPQAVDEPVTHGQLPAPEYPKSAIEAGQDGRVELAVKVGVDGRAAEVEVRSSSGVAALDAAAVDAVKGWTFNPARHEGQAVPSWILVPVTFSLDEDSVKQGPEPRAANDPSAAPVPAALDAIHLRAS